MEMRNILKVVSCGMALCLLCCATACSKSAETASEVTTTTATTQSTTDVATTTVTTTTTTVMTTTASTTVTTKPTTKKSTVTTTTLSHIQRHNLESDKKYEALYEKYAVFMQENQDELLDYLLYATDITREELNTKGHIEMNQFSKTSPDERSQAFFEKFENDISHAIIQWKSTDSGSMPEWAYFVMQEGATYLHEEPGIAGSAVSFYIGYYFNEEQRNNIISDFSKYPELSNSITKNNLYLNSMSY